jgi:hypothetical protein
MRTKKKTGETTQIEVDLSTVCFLNLSQKQTQKLNPIGKYSQTPQGQTMKHKYYLQTYCDNPRELKALHLPKSGQDTIVPACPSSMLREDLD